MLAFYGAFLAIVYRKTGSIVTTALAHGLLTDMAALMLALNLSRHYPGALSHSVNIFAYHPEPFAHLDHPNKDRVIWRFLYEQGYSSR